MCDIMARWPGLPVALLDALPHAVMVKDEAQQYIWVNAAFEDMIGMSRADLVGRPDDAVLPPRLAALCIGGDARVLETGEPDESHEAVECGRAGPRVMKVRKSRLHLGGRTLLMGIIEDVTELTDARCALTCAPRRDEMAG